jgi:hypothetical protein
MYHGTSYESATKFIVTRGDIWASMNEAGQLPRRAAGSMSKFTQVQEYDRMGWSVRSVEGSLRWADALRYLRRAIKRNHGSGLLTLMSRRAGL